MEDDWSNYLRNSKGDIFEMIKRAIMVAASDHPQDFQNKRDMIAQTLFSCDLIKCSKQSVNVGGTETKDQEATTVSEVLRMKKILENNSNESESVLLDSLSKIQHMVKSVNVLKLTGVGRSVNGLVHNHASKCVVKMSTTLVKEWRCMVDEWIKETEKMHQEKQLLPTLNQQRPMIVRIKMKKDPTVKESVPEQNDEVLRMKRILDAESVSESVVLESLKKLLNIRMCVKTLEATGIGRSVGVLHKHGSKDVRQIAWALVKKWKGIVDEYIKKESTSLNTERKIDSEKFKATKRKLHEAYEEAEKKKRKRRIQVIQLHELTRKAFLFQNKRHRHRVDYLTF
ncbi:hypothetical protein L1987_01782 [Smallanthus sonchifolius]|uniref:Uncharacterized protein n=1 Tax=Smallanthus sonchifolius TaxID=185202 RepID=A0ACB9K600_9ASTR|nr:hypothetical protein L1987_01782 [Smallanthus sonchifolius]